MHTASREFHSITSNISTSLDQQLGNISLSPRAIYRGHLHQKRSTTHRQAALEYQNINQHSTHIYITRTSHLRMNRLPTSLGTWGLGDRGVGHHVTVRVGVDHDRRDRRRHGRVGEAAHLQAEPGRRRGRKRLGLSVIGRERPPQVSACVQACMRAGGKQRKSEERS